MAVEEPRRIALHRAAAASWGEEVADTLMDSIAPPGHEVATREDIRGVLAAMDAMDARWDERFASMDARLASMDAKWDERLSSVDARWDERFASMDVRLASMDAKWDERLASMDVRLASMDAKWDERLGSVEQQSDVRLGSVEDRWGARFEAHEQRSDRRFHETIAVVERRIADAVTHQTRTLVWSQLGAVVVIAGLAFGLR